MNFGEYCKHKRIKNRITLREFCKKTNFDCGNYSKIERGLMNPPQNESTLMEWADVLNVDNVEYFLNLADVARDKIPTNIASNKKLIDLLPAFPPMNLSQEQLNELIKQIKSAFIVEK